MSSELVFRKGSAELLSYVGSSKMYEALHGFATYENWSSVPENALSWGLDSLHEKKEYFSSQIDKYKEAIKYLKNPEDIYDALDNLEEVKEELEEVNTAIIELRLIKEIQNYLQYNEEGEKIELPLEWMVC